MPFQRGFCAHSRSSAAVCCSRVGWVMSNSWLLGGRLECCLQQAYRVPVRQSLIEDKNFLYQNQLHRSHIPYYGCSTFIMENIDALSAAIISLDGIQIPY